VSLNLFFQEYRVYYRAVFDAFFFVMEKLNGSRFKLFLLLFERGCMTHYEFIQSGVLAPRILLNVVNNNVFFQKNVTLYLLVVAKWLEKNLVRLKFNGIIMECDVDPYSFDKSKENGYLDFDLFESCRGQVCEVSDPGVKKSFICLVTGDLVDDFYVYKYDNEIKVSRRFLDAYFECISPEYVYNEYLTFDKTNMTLIADLVFINCAIDGD